MGALTGGCLCGALRYRIEADATLDDPDAFRPSEHLWTEKAVRWGLIDDGLPRHPRERGSGAG
ncbi:MAG: hypothetical protein ACMVY4_15345 [Minwuia sp.]|uniref:hypothetical protein n=1 Tax=Minwuia sp. TaxID=2493630 RepID=UPI003A87FE2F